MIYWTIYVHISNGTDLHSEYAVEQLVEALRYMPEGRGFDSW